jgi:hypothetical protein
MRYFPLVLLLCLISCGDEGDGEFIQLPSGIHVRYTDQGTVASGAATLEDIYGWLEDEISKACVNDPRLACKAWSCAYDIIDNHSFIATDGHTWACGQWLGFVNTAKVALYSQAVGYAVPTDPPPPAWTVRMSWRDPALYVWGVMPPRFPALQHELEHAIGLPVP